MSYHGTNSNLNSYTRNYPKVFYKDFGNITNYPSAPQVMLNPEDGPMKATLDAYNRGLLSPEENNPVMLGGANYFSVNTGYGRDPENLYTVRSCSGVMGNPTNNMVVYGDKIDRRDWIAPGVPRTKPLSSKSWVETFKSFF